jgi:hypothetical protein
MSSGTASEIAQLLSPALQEGGFIRSGLSWYRYENESILVVNIQPAQYAPGPYINLGVYYYKYGRADKPDIVDCHVTTRLTRVVPNALREIMLLDMTNDISSTARSDELQEMIRNYGIPWLKGLAEFNAARSFLANSANPGHVAPIARTELKSFQK